MKTSKINPGIFKAYDIRGLYPQELDGEMAYRLGRALVVYTGAKKVVVGKDMRASSEILEDRLIGGILDQGAAVVRLGLATTPMLYFASGKLEVDAGIIITASHNPAQYNGFKMFFKEAVPIGEGAGMEEIRDLVLKNDFPDLKGEKSKVEDREDFRKQYFEYIKSFFNAEVAKITPRKIVVDFANGIGAIDKPILESLEKRGHLKASYLFEELDGNFPNHEANPLKTETLRELQETVKDQQADLGVAYDGDADRVGFVDEKGEVIPMDFITGLIAREVLKKHPGGKILMDLRSSNAVKEFVEAAGGIVKRCRVGHSLIKAQMRKEGAVFAGELSGHYFFEENYKAEMASLAVVMILNLLNETGRPMSELVKELKKYYHSGEINSEVQDKEAVFTKLKKDYTEGELDELDGVRIDFKDWWFNVRASNTEFKIRLNLEAKTKELMEERRDEVLNIIRS